MHLFVVVSSFFLRYAIRQTLRLLMAGGPLFSPGAPCSEDLQPQNLKTAGLPPGLRSELMSAEQVPN